MQAHMTDDAAFCAFVRESLAGEEAARPGLRPETDSGL